MDRYVSPFWGEFGWEIAMWIPWLRHRRAQCQGDHFVVVCNPGMEHLYEDFATEVVPAPSPEALRSDCESAWVSGVRQQRKDYMRVTLHAIRALNMDPKKLIIPDDMEYEWPAQACPRLIGKSIKAYGEFTRLVDREGIGFHARACVHKQPERNWLEGLNEVVEGLREAGHPVYAIGSPGQSICPLGAVDMRGKRMEAVTELLSGLRCVIGPSSGPLHLANMCRTRVFWWSGNKKDVGRYAGHWNYFSVKNQQLSKKWNYEPTAEEILQCL